MSHHDVDPIETLRAELSRIEVSPGFADRVRRQIGDDVIASIGSELSDMSVSPAFAVRVRQQIEAAPSRSRWFGLFNGRWAVPAAAAAVVLMAFVLSRGGNPGAPGVEPVAVTGRGPEVPSTPVTGTSSSLPAAQSAPSASASPATQKAQVQMAQRTAAPPTASSQQTEEKFEVITNQPAILQDWWARVGQSQVLSEATDETVAEMDTRDVVVSPVEVNPLVVKWLVEPPAAVALPFPFIRRVAAELAERSSR